jgi:glucosamine-6-phosphate deaminase
VNLRPELIHFLDGAAADLDAECDRYDAAIDGAGGIDLQILGIGSNGPHRLQRARRRSAGADASREADGLDARATNAALFGHDPSQVPREALSMGIGTILHARRIVLVATGGGKRKCIRQSVNGRITTRVPRRCCRCTRKWNGCSMTRRRVDSAA